MNSNILAGLLKRVYKEFDMKSFGNRFKLQKFFYLLKAWGLNLGYDFKLYLWGPYSTELANDGFEIKDFGNLPKIYFSEKDYEKRFEEFRKFFESYKDDEEKLELASSIHLIKNIYEGVDKEGIKKIIKAKRDDVKINNAKFNRTFKDLKDGGIINE